MKLPHPQTFACLVIAALIPAGAATDGSWPFFRGDTQMSGISKEVLKTPLVQAWKFKAEEGFIATAVISGGRVYIGSLDGNFYALELATGKQIWKFKTQLSIEGSAGVHGNTVVFGASDGFVYALSADKGELQWKHETGSEILGGTNLYHSKKTGKTHVLIGSYDNKLYCFDIANGNVIWEYETQGAVNGAPSIAGDRVLFGGCDTFIHSVSAETGKLADADKKPIEVGAPITNSIIVRGDKAYVAHYNNRVVSFDLATRALRWEFGERDFAFWASPAVTDDAVYVAGRDKRVYRINPENGEAVWDFKTRGRVDSSPVISGKTLYIGSDDGFLYALDTASGEELWSDPIGEDIRSSPAIAGGYLIIATGEGQVIAYKENKK